MSAKEKLCSNPKISNVDLYLAFYFAGLKPVDIAKLFDKPSSVVYQSIRRALDERAREQVREAVRRARQKKPECQERRRARHLDDKVRRYNWEQKLKELEEKDACLV